MMNKTGVIFDMDGVLVDTVNALYEIYLSILASYQIQGSKTEFNEFNGPSIKEVAITLSSRYQSMPTSEEIAKEFHTAHKSLYEDIELIPNARETLKELTLLGVKVALASSSSRNNINVILKRFNLSCYFHFTISGDEVNYAKPHPEIYQLAAKSLDSEYIYAIDDSFNGIKSALDAGISAIQFTKDQPVLNQNASYKINNLRRVSDIIQSDCQVLGQYSHFNFITDDFNLTPYLTLIDDYWVKFKGDSIFDGDALLHVRTQGNDIRVMKHKYRTVFYIINNPNSKLAQKLSSIGVSGFVLDIHNHILLAKRSSLVTQYKNTYECPPSGSIECINDYRSQILTELEEEANISKRDVSSFVAIALIKDKHANQFDIVFKIELKSTLKLCMQKNTEYDHFHFIAVKDLDSFIKKYDCLPETAFINQFLGDKHNDK